MVILLPNCFPQRQCHFTFPLAMPEGSTFPKPSPTFVHFLSFFLFPVSLPPSLLLSSFLSFLPSILGAVKWCLYFDLCLRDDSDVFPWASWPFPCLPRSSPCSLFLPLSSCFFPLLLTHRPFLEPYCPQQPLCLWAQPGTTKCTFQEVASSFSIRPWVRCALPFPAPLITRLRVGALMGFPGREPRDICR